jgi:hypothetical protein
MKLLIFRNLYVANHGLLQAVEALSEIANEPKFSRKMLWLTQERIEEVRAWMNTTLAESIDHLEMERGNALEGQRARREERAVKAVKARMKASSSSKSRPTSTRRSAAKKS